MQHTVGRRLRRINDEDSTHWDRILLPILQRLAQARQPVAAVAQGRVRLTKPMRNLLFHLVERGLDLVCSQHDPAVPANRLEGWFDHSGSGPA